MNFSVRRHPEPVDAFRKIDLSAIIVSYNTRELTLDCVRSLYAETCDVPFEVLVVDNASTDGSPAAIAAAFPDVRLFTLDRNLGFAAANNFAAQHARGDWLLLLNPDTVVLDRAVDRLFAFASDEVVRDRSRVIFGGRTLNGAGVLEPSSCWNRPTVWTLLCRACGLSSVFRGSPVFNSEAIPGWRRDSVHEVDIVTGCFLMLPRSVWNRLGGFDDSFFMYAEEADFCLRAATLGYHCVIYPGATIVHYGGASEKLHAEKLIRLFRAKHQLHQKHWKPHARPLSALLLKFHVVQRAVVFGLAAQLISSRWRDPAQEWSAVWLRRAEWLNLD